MPKAQKPKKPRLPKSEVVKITKAQLFAEAYVRLQGNGSAAALEVFEAAHPDSAATIASEYLRKPQVQEYVKAYLETRAIAYKKFLDQSEYYLHAVGTRILRKLEEDDLSVEEIERLAVLLARFAGKELSESVATARITERARGRAVLGGVPAPGIQPGAQSPAPAGGAINARNVLFMLSPPPMPPGGKPPPAMEEQWRAVGWRPAEEVQRDAAAGQ